MARLNRLRYKLHQRTALSFLDGGADFHLHKLTNMFSYGVKCQLHVAVGLNHIFALGHDICLYTFGSSLTTPSLQVLSGIYLMSNG